MEENFPFAQLFYFSLSSRMNQAAYMKCMRGEEEIRQRHWNSIFQVSLCSAKTCYSAVQISWEAKFFHKKIIIKIGMENYRI